MRSGILVLLLAAASARAQAIDEAAVRSALKEARPIVEEISGRRLEALPELVLAGEDRLREVLREARRDDPLSASLGPATQMLLAEEARQVLAVYVMTEGRIYVSLEHLATNYAALLEPGREADYLVPLMGHELIHALDDRIHGFAAHAKGLEDPDSQQAFTALYEGRAILAEEAIARRRGAGDVFERRFELLRTPPDDGRTPIFVRDLFAQNVLFPYVEGRAFVSWVVEHRGARAVDDLLADPPRTTAEVLDPGRRYDPPEVPEELGRIAPLLARGEERLGGEGWTLRRSAPTGKDLWFGLVGAPEEERRQVVRSLRGGTKLTLQSTKDPLTVFRAASLAVHATPEAARAAVEAGRRAEAAKDETVGRAPGGLVQVIESTETPIALPAAAGYARVRTYRVLSLEQRAYFAAAACGRVVIEFAAANDTAAEEAMRGLLERFAEDLAR